MLISKNEQQKLLSASKRRTVAATLRAAANRLATSALPAEALADEFDDLEEGLFLDDYDEEEEDDEDTEHT
jgi:hypothetical protein